MLWAIVIVMAPVLVRKLLMYVRRSLEETMVQQDGRLKARVQGTGGSVAQLLSGEWQMKKGSSMCAFAPNDKWNAS